MKLVVESDGWSARLLNAENGKHLGDFLREVAAACAKHGVRTNGLIWQNLTPATSRVEDDINRDWAAGAATDLIDRSAAMRHAMTDLFAMYGIGGNVHFDAELVSGSAEDLPLMMLLFINPPPMTLPKR